MVAVLHFIYAPTQGIGNLLGIRHHRNNQMRQLGIRLHFHHFRIHQNKPQFIRTEFQKHGGNDAVDAHGFPGSGGTGHQQVRHGCQVPDHGASIHVFPQRQRNLFLGGTKSRILQKFPQGNGYLLPVDNFNTYRILARNGGHDVHAFRLGRQRNILRILVKSIYAHAARGIHFITGDGRASGNIPRRHVHAECRQGINNLLLYFQHFFLVLCRRAFRLFFIMQQFKGRQLILAEFLRGRSGQFGKRLLFRRRLHFRRFRNGNPGARSQGKAALGARGAGRRDRILRLGLHDTNFPDRPRCAADGERKPGPF